MFGFGPGQAEPDGSLRPFNHCGQFVVRGTPATTGGAAGFGTNCARLLGDEPPPGSRVGLETAAGDVGLLMDGPPQMGGLAGGVA